MLTHRSLLCALALGGVACHGTEQFTPVPTSIDLAPGMVSFGSLGRIQLLVAVVRDQRGDTIAAPSIQWSVGNGSVASVDAAGHVTAVGVGVTQAYATVLRSSGPILDSTAISVTQVPAQITKVSGDQQLDTAAATLPAALVAQVNDSTAHPIAGIVVNFVVTQGGGGLSAGADTTDALGRAGVLWTLGPGLGANTITATAAGVGISGNPATFGAQAVAAGSRPTVASVAGDAQTGLVGSAVNTPPTVLVRNAGGTPLAGKTVTFTITVGGGSVQGGSALTDAAGRAHVGAWSLTAGANALTATVQDTGAYVGNPVTFTATGAAAAYHIEVRFLVATTPSRQAAFTSAASRWESLIFGDVPDVALNRTSVCGVTQTVNTVDDVLILAVLDSIDGPGNILGQAGPCVTRSGSNLPIVGIMEFDTSDVAGLEASGRFALVIEHEMGHVLGFGTGWGGLLVDPVTTGNPAADPHFTGTQALDAFDHTGGVSYGLSAKVPVENTGGPGTRNAHWRESVFKNELMTGFINGGSNPLSVVTTASMGDLGYLVNYASSDVYVVPPAPPAPAPPALAASTLVMGDDIWHGPIIEVDASGRVVRTIPPR